MLKGKQLIRSLTALVILTLTSSCAVLKIPAPGPEAQTLLVLPIKITNSTNVTKHAFYYIYQIENRQNKSQTYEAVIKLPRKGNLLVLDNLPPGKYRVSQFTYLPVGSGVSYSGNNVSRRNDPFTLDAGKITVFDRTLHVKIRNQNPGRMGTTYFSFSMDRLSDEQRSEVWDTLKSLDNFESWNKTAGLSKATQNKPDQGSCDDNERFQDAIYEAQTASQKAGKPAEVQDLIYQAQAAARLPECDPVRAGILLDKAMDLLEQN